MGKRHGATRRDYPLTICPIHNPRGKLHTVYEFVAFFLFAWCSVAVYFQYVEPVIKAELLKRYGCDVNLLTSCLESSETCATMHVCALYVLAPITYSVVSLFVIKHIVCLPRQRAIRAHLEERCKEISEIAEARDLGQVHVNTDGYNIIDIMAKNGWIMMFSGPKMDKYMWLKQD